MRNLFSSAFRMVFGATLALAGCDGLDAYDANHFDLADAVAVDRDTGKPLLGAARVGGLEVRGPSVSGLSSNTEVWSATRRWYERDAGQGMAWPAGNDLTWDQKYAAWIDAMEQTVGDDGTMTVELLTPLGQRVPSPRLECAEMGMFLRATFASWYNLPFFMTAVHPQYGEIHFGHFGVVDASGRTVPGFPNYRTRYPDETGRGMAALDAWPSDHGLAARKLTPLADDYNLWLGDDAYAGAYFDHVLLNKRVGHFLHVLLTSFGSMHLAGSTNTFDLDPHALREGDLLIHRWQRQGIGHAMVVKEVDQAEFMSAELMFGSMPRIQPVWYDADRSRSYFLSENGGGKDLSADGVSYAELGGGLKRWRTPVVKNGRWLNIVPVVDRPMQVDSADTVALAARLDTLETLFGALSVDEEIAAALDRIELARNNLRQRPASCANRTRREEAFDALYELYEQQGVGRAAVDAQHRTLEDYVFGELEYDQARTCCWNSTTPDMYAIVMDFAQQGSAGINPGTCEEPLVFKARLGGYAMYEAFAEATGRGHLWRDWSADETCPQSAMADDAEANAPFSAYCETGLASAPAPTADPCGGITWEGQCDGNTVQWCADGEVHEVDCETDTCSWDGANSYMWCL